MSIRKILVRHGAVASLMLVVLLCQATARSQVLGGDFRNTTINIANGLNGDVALNVQTGRDGNATVKGGVTVKAGDKVSFDNQGRLKTDTAGFWKGEKDAKYKVLFRGQDGKPLLIVELRGEVRWDSSRNISAGADNFLRVATTDDKFIEISDRDLKTGQLVVSTKDGSKFKLYGLSCDFTGVAFPVGQTDSTKVGEDRHPGPATVPSDADRADDKAIDLVMGKLEKGHMERNPLVCEFEVMYAPILEKMGGKEKAIAMLKSAPMDIGYTSWSAKKPYQYIVGEKFKYAIIPIDSHRTRLGHKEHESGFLLGVKTPDAKWEFVIADFLDANVLKEFFSDFPKSVELPKHLLANE